MLRVRQIETPEHLRAALALFELVHPGSTARTGRDAAHFAALLARPEAVLLAAEGRGGPDGVLLGTPWKDDLLYLDCATAPGVDAEGIAAALIAAAVPAARDRGHLRVMSAVARGEAEFYASEGFAPTLLIQLEGEQRFERRRALLRQLAGRRPLRLSEWGRPARAGEAPPVAQAWLRVDRVDLALHDDLSRPRERLWAQFLMHRWAAPERRPRFVVSFHDRFRHPVVAELRDVDPDLETHARLHGGALEVQAGRPGHDLSPAFRAQEPVFVQHLAPATEVVPLDGTPADLERLLDRVRRLAGLERGRSLAVECRKGRRTASGPHEVTAYTVRDVEVRVGSGLAAAGYAIDLVAPRQVMSIYLEGDRALVGVADPADTLATWADEARRRARTPTTISRAEHKLAEALERFDVAVRPGQRALDLGAAPGGWSYLLAERGLEVLSVDPAALDARVAAHPNVRHLRERAEALRLPPDSVDLVVNDTNLDPADSARLLCAVAPCLKPSGVAIMTLKLPFRRPEPSLRRALDALTPAFEVLALRHLPHNRQEVTALLQPAAPQAAGRDHTPRLNPGGAAPGGGAAGRAGTGGDRPDAAPRRPPRGRRSA